MGGPGVESGLGDGSEAKGGWKGSFGGCWAQRTGARPGPILVASGPQGPTPPAARGLGRGCAAPLPTPGGVAPTQMMISVLAWRTTRPGRSPKRTAFNPLLTQGQLLHPEFRLWRRWLRTVPRAAGPPPGLPSAQSAPPPPCRTAAGTTRPTPVNLPVGHHPGDLVPPLLPHLHDRAGPTAGQPRQGRVPQRLPDAMNRYLVLACPIQLGTTFTSGAARPPPGTTPGALGHRSLELRGHVHSHSELALRSSPRHSSARPHVRAHQNPLHPRRQVLQRLPKHPQLLVACRPGTPSARPSQLLPSRSSAAGRPCASCSNTAPAPCGSR